MGDIMSKKQLEELYAQLASHLLAFVRAGMAGKQASKEIQEDLLLGPLLLYSRRLTALVPLKT